jgi:hypothetical protein
MGEYGIAVPVTFTNFSHAVEKLVDMRLEVHFGGVRHLRRVVANPLQSEWPEGDFIFYLQTRSVSWYRAADKARDSLVRGLPMAEYGPIIVHRPMRAEVTVEPVEAPVISEVEEEPSEDDDKDDLVPLTMPEVDKKPFEAITAVLRELELEYGWFFSEWREPPTCTLGHVGIRLLKTATDVQVIALRHRNGQGESLWLSKGPKDLKSCILRLIDIASSESEH